MPTIGKNVTLGKFAEIGENAEIGGDCVVHGCVEGKIGDRTKVWRFAHVMAGAVVGSDSQVCNGAIVLTDAVVGSRCSVQIGSSVARKTIIEDDVFIAPGVVFCNAKKPYVGYPHSELIGSVVKRGAAIGANCSVMPCVTIGEEARVGAGCVVTGDVAPGTVVVMSARMSVLP